MRSSERGNAVIFILIAVALFAALMYTFMRSGQQGQGNLSAGQARLAAQEIINFGQKVEKVINKLRVRGCSENQISFYDPASTTYGFRDSGYNHSGNSNLVMPECAVFKPEGGGMTSEDFRFPAEYFALPYEKSWGALQDGYYSAVSAKVSVRGVGTNAADLVYAIFGLKLQICEEINRQLGIQSTTLPDLLGNPNANIDFKSGVDYAVWDTTTTAYSGVRSLAGITEANRGPICSYIHTIIER